MQGPAECRGEVCSFSTVLGPLIMISLRRAAPSRYQHIISGLVQPLNHTRPRNPLVSVTFSPTQEARSQSAIWMLCSLSLYLSLPPQHIFSIPSLKTFPKHCLAISFSAFVPYCVFPFVSGQQSPCISSHDSISFIPPKTHFLLMPLVNKMYSIQGNLAAGELTFFPMACLKHVKLCCDNHIACIFLEIRITL